MKSNFMLIKSVSKWKRLATHSHYDKKSRVFIEERKTNLFPKDI